MPGFWRKCRTTFRWCRFTLWTLLLIVLMILFWLNRVGLPDFLKARLVTALHDQGVRLEFSRMHLSFVHGLVADNVRIGGTQTTGSPAFAAREVQLHLDFGAWLHGRWQVDGLAVRDGGFTLANPGGQPLALTNLQTAVEFKPDGTWLLGHFSANFAAASLIISGQVAHAPEVSRWKIFSGRPGGGRSALTGPLQEFADTMAQIHFIGQPTLALKLDGDARDVHSMLLTVNANAPGMRTPWFSAVGFRWFAELTAPMDAPTNPVPDLGFWTNLQPFCLKWRARTEDLRVRSFSMDNLVLAGEWRAPDLTIRDLSAQIEDGQWHICAGLNVGTRRVAFTNDSSFDPHLLDPWLTAGARAQLAHILWTQPPALHLSGCGILPPWTEAAPDWRNEIGPTVQLAGELGSTNTVVANTTLDYLHAQFDYTNQFWNLRALELGQGRTRLVFDGTADESAHAFSGHLRGALAGDSVRPFLPGGGAMETFNHFGFSAPLVLDATLQGDWADWRTLSVSGEAALTNFSATTPAGGQLAVDALRMQFNYANQIWTVKDLQLAQGRTQLSLAGAASLVTGNLRVRARGAFDIGSVRAFLPTEKDRQGFGMIDCRQPLAFNLALEGNWRDFDSLMATGRVALADFSIHEQAVDNVSGDFLYTNRQLQFFHPQLTRDGGRQALTADVVRLDFVNLRIYFTNGSGVADPLAVARAIGPKTGKMLEPYQFLGLPSVHVEGCSPMREVNNGQDEADADLYFTLREPVPFRTGKIRTPQLLGTLHWLGQRLILTNLTAVLYNGNGRGGADFDFSPAHPGADYKFYIAVTNVDLHLLAADLSSPTNTLQGALSGEVTVTNASTETWRSWNGYGQMQLHNGLLWNVPIFGLASAALNLFSPGLGNSQATDATARFGITNGVIHSDSVEMHTATMRLQYSGTVDLEQNVNARVTAQLLRNTPVLGTVFSTMLWPFSKIFECQVTGQLDDPQVTPIYVPFSKVLLSPIHSLRSVQEMLSPGNNAPGRN